MSGQGPFTPRSRLAPWGRLAQAGGPAPPGGRPRGTGRLLPGGWSGVPRRAAPRGVEAPPGRPEPVGVPRARRIVRLRTRGQAAAGWWTGGVRPAAALVLAAFVLSAGGVTANAAGDGSAGTDELRPSFAHRQSAQAIVQIMNRYHYRKVPLDDELGSRVLDRYLDFFDPSRSVFLASDIAEFDVHRTRVDDALRRGRFDLAFAVLERYRVRTAERAEAAAAFVGREFDFSRDEHFEIDRSTASWARDPAELDEHWRRRVKNDFLELELTGQDPETILEALRMRYARMARRVHQIDADDVVQYFLNAYTQSIDPHSTYFSPRTSENFRIRMSLSLEGIGAALQTVGEHTVVRRIVPGGPADRSGELRAEDRIVGVRQSDEARTTDVVSWRLEDVVSLIRGPKGSTVHLRILPAAGLSGAPRTISLVRDRIELEDQSASRRILESGTADGSTLRIGVIDIPSFYLDLAGRSAGRENYRSTSRDVERLLAELRHEGIDGLVVDLRGNQGGSLDEALLVAGLFIEHGPIVQIRKSSGRTQARWDEDPSVAWGGPLAVLVNRGSASASEIFAGAIQDYRRGLVVGTRTYGKGTVQNLIDLPPYGGKGRLKLTVAQYFRINGEGVQRSGIEPDVDFAPAAGEEPDGERDLEAALPWARIRAAGVWRAGSRSEETVTRVRERSRKRLTEETPLRLLGEEAGSGSRQRGTGAFSLHRERRREAHAEAEAGYRRLFRTLGEAVRDGGPEGGALASLADFREELLLQEAARVVADFISYQGRSERALARN